MSDKLLASLVSVAILAALALWVPVLDRIQHFVSKQVSHKQED